MNFALFSENTDGVELCLFDGPDSEVEITRIRLTEHPTRSDTSIYRKSGPAAGWPWKPGSPSASAGADDQEHDPTNER